MDCGEVEVIVEEIPHSHVLPEPLVPALAVVELGVGIVGPNSFVCLVVHLRQLVKLVICGCRNFKFLIR